MQYKVPPLPGVEDAAVFVRGDSDGYRALCGVLVGIMERSGVPFVELQDVLMDIGDIFDGRRPSKRSGFVQVDKVKKAK